MEVRCGKCNKLFRVSDDKITGKGIKFPCSRCGEYIMIAHEDVAQHSLSHGAGSLADLFDPKPAPVAAPPLSPAAADPAAGGTARPEHGSQSFDLGAQAMHGHALEEKAPSFAEPVHVAPSPASHPETVAELRPEPLLPEKSKAEFLTEKRPEQRSEQRSEQKPEPLFVSLQQAGPAAERKTPQAPPIQPAVPKIESPRLAAPQDSPAGERREREMPQSPPIQQTVPKKDYVRSAAPPASPAAERIVMEPIYSSTATNSGRMFLVLLVTLIIFGLAAYGIYYYLQPSPPSPQSTKEAPREMTAIEGLQIVNPVGSLDANGDLLISGTIENAAEKERPAWCVEAVVNNAQGSELARIKFLNGRQIYTRRDYDILAKRGANVPELKAKSLQEKGVVIPPKGTAKFEILYLQPTPGTASFHTQVLSFDPIQMNKEIAAEIN